MFIATKVICADVIMVYIIMVYMHVCKRTTLKFCLDTRGEEGGWCVHVYCLSFLQQGIGPSGRPVDG